MLATTLALGVQSLSCTCRTSGHHSTRARCPSQQDRQAGSTMKHHNTMLQARARTHLRDEPAGCMCRCLVAKLNKAKALAFLGARMSAHVQRSRHQAVCMSERHDWLWRFPCNSSGDICTLGSDSINYSPLVKAFRTAWSLTSGARPPTNTSTTSLRSSLHQDRSA